MSTISSLTTGASATPAGGRGGGRNNNRRGSRAGRGGGTGQSATGSTTAARRSTFKCDTEEMNGNVFECYEEQVDRRQYAKTLQALNAYSRKTMEGAADLASLFDDTPTEPVLAEPGDMTAVDLTSEVKKLIFQEKVKRYVQRLEYLESNIATLYSVIWGQCSDDMKARVKNHEKYKESTKENNCVWLLGQIKAVTLQFDSKKDSVLCILHARRSFANCRQLPGQSVEDYAESLIGWANTIKAQGDSVSVNYNVIPAKDADGKERSTEARQKLAYNLTMARALIDGADQSRYGTLITELANQHAKGRSEYPADFGIGQEPARPLQNTDQLVAHVQWIQRFRRSQSRCGRHGEQQRHNYNHN